MLWRELQGRRGQTIHGKMRDIMQRFALTAAILLTLAACSRLEPNGFPSRTPEVLTEAAATSVPTETPLPPKSSAIPQPPFARDTRPGSINRDVTYCTRNDVALKMDIDFPRQAENAAMPIAVYVHGGAWSSGDKGSGPGMLDMPELLARGYIVAAVNYRLAPQYKFPAQIEDVKCAIRFLRANASDLHIDPNRVGAWGSSAGGHLVALLGLTDASAGFDVGEYLDQSSGVQAVVDMFGPTDLMTWFRGAKRAIVQLSQRVFGTTSKDDPMLVRGSPVTYVSKGAPPFLILQGDKDRLVPPSQSQELYDRLKAAGANVNLVMVKKAGHGFIPRGTINPSRADLTKRMADFFDENLR